MPHGDEFERRLAAARPVARWFEAGVLVAFSGGADSTALLAALAALQPPGGRRLAAAHFNHRLRGADSEADAAHCVELSQRLGLRCEVGLGQAAALAEQAGDGLEAAARTERYAFLEAIAARLGFRYVATAHTLDDQAETVLHRLLRGTGLAGLSGIPRARSAAGGALGLVRPLLEFRRGDVLDYVRRRGLPYRTDASNADPRFTRNRLRLELLPQLARDYNPRVVETLARLAAQADELREVVDELIEPLAEAAIRRADAECCEIDGTPLRAAPRHLVRAVLVVAWQRSGWPQQAMGYDHWNALAALALGESTDKRMFPGDVLAERQGDTLRLRRAPL